MKGGACRPTPEVPMLATMNRSFTIVVLLWFFTGCTPEAPSSVSVEAPRVSTAEAANPVAATVIQRAERVRTPERYVKDITLSEIAATATQKVIGRLCRLIDGRGLAEDDEPFAENFGARWGTESEKQDDGVAGLARRELQPDDAWGDAETLTGRLAAWGQALQEVTSCQVKHFGFRLGEGDGIAWGRSHLTLMGVTRDGGRIERRAVIQATFLSSPWRIEAVELLSGEVLQAGALGFQDVSEQVGVRQYRSPVTDRVIQNQVDAGSIETMGGLGVIDWNRDGRDDVMSWVRDRTFQVFINDGHGGFDALVNPIPPERVGLAMLYVDLDGNGRPELVSSQVVGCENGIGWLGLHEHTENGLVDRGDALRFPLDCAAHRRARFQHLNVDDVDGDGDLDLFVGGFRLGAMDQKRNNVFRATSGLPNLLFRNDGRLTFTERARKGGFAGTDLSYGSVFLDLDKDGDRDLYVVNDYGPNRAYRNLGAARFEQMEIAALTANGQSMGVTVADLTGDGAWDIYVSNMYSHAGNRIVPLTRGSFQESEFGELLRLATGNALYTSTGDGYEDMAEELGVAEAGWAWGQAVFDPDNDGDWDLYVVNGNTSNRDARAPDY